MGPAAEEEGEEDTETIATRTAIADDTTMTATRTVMTDGATDPGPGTRTETGTEADLGEIKMAGVTGPCHGKDHTATVARHATHTSRGVGETLTAKMPGTGAMERPGTGMVC